MYICADYVYTLDRVQSTVSARFKLEEFRIKPFSEGLSRRWRGKERKFRHSAKRSPFTAHDFASMMQSCVARRYCDISHRDIGS